MATDLALLSKIKILIATSYASLRPITLDMAWNRAKEIGEPKLEKAIWGNEWRATIQIKPLPNANLFVHGVSDSEVEALLIAINDANKLLGKPEVC